MTQGGTEGGREGFSYRKKAGERERKTEKLDRDGPREGETGGMESEGQ